MDFDLFIVRATKVIGLLLGSGIMVYETIGDHTDRPYLYAAALMMMGLQIAEVVEKVASGFGASKNKLDEQKQELDRKQV